MKKVFYITLITLLVSCNCYAGKLAEAGKAAGATATGAGVGYVAGATYVTMGGIVFKSAGIGSSGGPIGAIAGGLLGLGGYAVYKVFTEDDKTYTSNVYNKTDTIQPVKTMVEKTSISTFSKIGKFIFNHPIISILFCLFGIGAYVDIAIHKKNKI